RPTRVMNEEIGGLQRQLLILGAGASLIVLISMTLLGRNMRRQKEIEARLANEHTHLIEAQRIARLGSWEMDWLDNRVFKSEEIDRILDLQGRKPPASPLEYLELVHPDDRGHLQQAFEASLAKQQAGNMVHRIRTASGQLKWLRAMWQSSYSRHGKPLRTSGTLLDITERKREQHEREALARERMLLLESTGEGILGVDTQGVCTFINQAGARMLGYTPEELAGKAIQALIQPCRADGSPYAETETPLYQAFAQGIASTHEDAVFRHQDGHAIAVEYLVHPILDAQSISGAVLNFSDITHRKETETELRIAEKAFQTQEGMFVTDERGVILRINNAFTEITGFTAEDIVGKNPRMRSSGRHDAAFYEAMWQRIQSTGAWKGEIWNRRKSGEIYPESLTITAVTGKDAAVSHYVATMHDISDRKAAEEEIRHLAFYDPLTRLPNRRLLEDRLQHALLNSQRKRRHGAIMFLDLDKFKALNDNWGHDAGDLMLQIVARRLLDCVRDTDTVARLGGDEFVVLLEDLHEQAAASRLQSQQIGQKIMATLNLPYDLDGRRHRITPSIGATLFLGQTEPIEDLLKQADLAMYKAKTSGRNSLCFYAHNMLNTAPAPLSL
ncbi:MAG: diguanylate cyclase, partial [Hylemonella sp.]|nr:diguanylate cyclase [Hylemonella sp.]